MCVCVKSARAYVHVRALLSTVYVGLLLFFVFLGCFLFFFYYFSMEVFHVIHAGGWRVQTRLSIQEEPQEAFEQAMECALVCAERRWIHAVV